MYKHLKIYAHLSRRIIFFQISESITTKIKVKLVIDYIIAVLVTKMIKIKLKILKDISLLLFDFTLP